MNIMKTSETNQTLSKTFAKENNASWSSGCHYRIK